MAIKNCSEDLVECQDQIQEVAVNYFKDLLGSSPNDYPGYDTLSQYITTHITNLQANILETPILNDEIYTVEIDEKK